MKNKYIFVATLAILAVYSSFFYNFYIHLNYKISNQAEHWGQFGDYIGGLLNPVLSFISIFLLIRSLGIQNETNESVKDELRITKKTEKLRTFETLFFNLLNSQKNLFDNLKVDFMVDGVKVRKTGAEAVFVIEDRIEEFRAGQKSNSEIFSYIESVDSNERIYDLIRVFYINVKLITDRLCDEEDFRFEDRKSYFLTLINFTDFAQLRLVLIGMQFFNYPSVAYIKGNAEFTTVLNSVNLKYDPY